MPFPNTDNVLQKNYKAFLLTSAFSCVVFPVFLTIFAALVLPRQGLLCVLSLELVLALIPLKDVPPPNFIQRVLQDATRAAVEWMSIKVVYNMEDFIAPGPYVIGLEPHSVLPVAVPAIMNTHAGVLPPSCRNCHSLATSAAFWVPFGRHVWWWLSIRPATRKTFQNLLSRGKTVCVTPGGVQECLYMEPGHEVAFLKKRLGFIRIAIKQGAPLVPCFAFGQSDLYNYHRPAPPLVPRSVLEFISRKIGFVPIIFTGAWGTTMPLGVPMTVVLGTPIPTTQNASPSDEECRHYNEMFIKELERLFYEHRKAAGYPKLELHVM